MIRYVRFLGCPECLYLVYKESKDYVLVFSHDIYDKVWERKEYIDFDIVLPDDFK